MHICLFFTILWNWAIVIFEKTYVLLFNDKDKFCQKRFNQILKCFLNCFTNLTVCNFKKFHFVEIIFFLLNVNIKQQHVFAAAMFSEVRASKTFYFTWFLLIISIIIASIWYTVLLYDRFVFWFILFEIIFWICFIFDFCLSTELFFFLTRKFEQVLFVDLIWLTFFKKRCLTNLSFWKCLRWTKRRQTRIIILKNNIQNIYW